MKILRMKRWVLALPLLVASQASIGASLGGNPTETIKTLFAQGQFEQAYELGRAAEFNWEGDPEFDFNYGLAAIESGHYEDAIFALERVVFHAPIFCGCASSWRGPIF